MSDPNDIYSNGVEVLAPAAYLCDSAEVAHAIADAECARTGNYPDDDDSDDSSSGGTVIDAASLFGIWD